jgi:DNA topoisomerase-6 subunit B
MALLTKTPAEFFAENRNIAGFDNDGKALYTTVREFVENSLDAAESVHVPPCVEVTMCVRQGGQWVIVGAVSLPGFTW